MSLQNIYDKAKKEGRLCLQCGGVISKGFWIMGYKICWFCWDANKGVNITFGCHAESDDFPELTGESL